MKNRPIYKRVKAYIDTLDSIDGLSKQSIIDNISPSFTGDEIKEFNVYHLGILGMAKMEWNIDKMDEVKETIAKPGYLDAQESVESDVTALGYTEEQAKDISRLTVTEILTEADNG